MIFIGALLGFFSTFTISLLLLSFFDVEGFVGSDVNGLFSAASGTVIGGFVVFYLQYVVGRRKELREIANSYNEIMLSTHLKLVILEGLKEFMREASKVRYRFLHISQPLDIKKEPRASIGELVRLDGSYHDGVMAAHFLSAEETYSSLMLKFEERARARGDLLASLENLNFKKSSAEDVLRHGDFDALVRLYYHTEELLSDLDRSIHLYRIALKSLHDLGTVVFKGSQLKLYSPEIKDELEVFPEPDFLDYKCFRIHLKEYRDGLLND